MKKLLFLLTLSAALTAVPATSFAFSADDEAGCFEQLSNCYYEAARRASWVDRWLAGLDCELDFVECTRIKLVGR
jgi:hypothetical protein